MPFNVAPSAVILLAADVVATGAVSGGMSSVTPVCVIVLNCWSFPTSSSQHPGFV